MSPIVTEAAREVNGRSANLASFHSLAVVVVSITSILL
jgi:hypothetical protein